MSRLKSPLTGSSTEVLVEAYSSEPTVRITLSRPSSMDWYSSSQATVSAIIPKPVASSEYRVSFSSLPNSPVESR